MSFASFVRGLFRMSHRAKLPRLRHHFTNGRQMDEKDDQVHILLEAGLMRDWTHAKRLAEKRKQSADELYWELSKAARPNWRKRLRTRIIRLLGGLTYDPYRAEIIRLSKGIYTKPHNPHVKHIRTRQEMRVINSPQPRD